MSSAAGSRVRGCIGDAWHSLKQQQTCGWYASSLPHSHGYSEAHTIFTTHYSKSLSLIRA